MNTTAIASSARLQRPATPVVRYVGGKERLLDALFAALPTAAGRMYEPFVGAGAVVLGSQHPAERYVVSDASTDAVALLTALRDHPDQLVQAVQRLDADRSANAFRTVRALDPAGLTIVERAARFVFLQTLGFNGLPRHNRAGRYNASYGYANAKPPSIRRDDSIRAASRRLQGVTIRGGDFVGAVVDARPGDVVYCDPPYVATFSAYTAAGFDENEHRRLSATISALVARGVRVALSNSLSEETLALYRDSGLDFYAVAVQRSVACSAGSRGVVEELLGLSYPLDESASPERAGQLLRPLRP